jgi:hypothetical protein
MMLDTANIANTSMPCKPLYAMRWDKANLYDYYEATRIQLASIVVDPSYCKCNNYGCLCVGHCDVLSVHFDQIINALQIASHQNIPMIPLKSLRPFWYDEPDELKSKAYFLV